LVRKGGAGFFGGVFEPGGAGGVVDRAGRWGRVGGCGGHFVYRCGEALLDIGDVLMKL